MVFQSLAGVTKPEGIDEIKGYDCKQSAAAIEAFPFARGVKVGREWMVGVEALFAACGFEVTRRPSPARVVMRKDL